MRSVLCCLRSAIVSSHAALGGISWAATVGLLAYLAGNAVDTLVRDFGIVAFVVVAVIGVGLIVARRRRSAV